MFKMDVFAVILTYVVVFLAAWSLSSIGNSGSPQIRHRSGRLGSGGEGGKQPCPEPLPTRPVNVHTQHQGE